uniref:C3H1-type domain-containing protein n=1 Tax=Hordeum vulgare subsp. vulgare TaxID=112509 RepID=A0A8I7BHW7_HORVV
MICTADTLLFFYFVQGSECEYRHSDAARVNPRDCWYWFNGNCANAKCSFRHPPLDDMLGAPATPRAPQQPAPQVPVPAKAVPPNGTAKPVVPCYYFQKGMCAKGNLCTFSHGPQFAGNPALQLKNSNSWTKANNSPQQSTTPVVHGELKAGAQNGRPAQKQNPTNRAYHSSGIYQNQNNNPYVLSGAAKSYQPHRSVEAESAENVMETGEFVREPSAGSSVLAGSAEDDAERSIKEGHNSSYRRASGEQNSGVRRQAHGGYELERSSHRSSSDRLVSERRLTQRDSMPVTAESSDLRHRLLKQRRLNDSRSTEVPDRRDRRYPEDERDSHLRRRGEERTAHDSLSRSRLHGRIKLPGETSLDRLGPHPHLEKERGHRDRLSPPKQTDLRAKLHDRLKARSNEDVPGNLKSSVVKAISGEDAGVVNFSGPKSLAELRAKKVAYSSGENTVKNADRIARPARMTSEIVAKDSPDPVPFDGPKPLSVILKRKREAASADSGSMQEEQVAGQVEQSLNNSGILDTNTEDVEEEEEFHPEDDVMYDDDGLSPADDNTAEAAGDADKEELEEGQQEDLETAAEEEYDYEAADDANAEGENDYQEYEDDDDLEDDDDFARKVGVLIS